MKTPRQFAAFGLLAASAFAVLTFAGCADDKTSSGGTCKGDAACCSSDKDACCKDSAAKSTDGKATDMKAKDGMKN